MWCLFVGTVKKFLLPLVATMVVTTMMYIHKPFSNILVGQIPVLSMDNF